MKKTGTSFYKRTAALLGAVLMLTSVAGCSKNSGSSDGNGGGSAQNNTSDKAARALNISFDHSYKSEQIDISGIRYFNGISEINGNLLCSGYSEEDGTIMYCYNIENGTSTPLELAYPKTLDKNVDYYIAANFVNSEKQPVFIYHTSFYDEKNEEEPYQDLGFTMEIYDADFNVVETKEMKDIFDENTYFSSMIQGPDGNYYAAVQCSDPVTRDFSMKLYIYDKDFQKTGEVAGGDIQYVQQMFVNKDGKIVINYQNTDWKNSFGFLNTETNTLDPVQVDGMPQWFNLSFSGTKDYDLFVGDSTSAYGINLTAGTCEEVINWINSDFMADNISQMIQLDDGRFVLVSEDYTSNSQKSEIWLLEKRDPKDFENVQLISLATLYMPTELGKAISKFNRTHTDYRIGVMNYEQYNTEDDYEAGLNQFENDMTSGILADIICMSYMPYERYANKGLLMDFSDYVSQLNPDEYFMNFFDSLKYGGKLYRMGFSYNVNTLEAKTEKVNGKNGLSLQEFIDLIYSLPEGTEAFPEMTKNSALSELASTFLMNFIDIDTAACTFNSPEFVKLLELCNSYPADEDESRSDWTDEQWDKFWAEEDYRYINNKTLFHSIYISNIGDYFREKATAFGDADVTLVGYPTAAEGSNGGKFNSDYLISASANSAVKDQIWEFCQQMLSEESQENLSWSLPVRKEAFDKAAAEALKPDITYDEEGNKQELDYISIWRGNEEVHIPLPAQADTDKIKDYISNVKETMYFNEQVYNIVYEEAEKYFSGDQTSQAAADMIQSRVSIYLSEQT